VEHLYRYATEVPIPYGNLEVHEQEQLIRAVQNEFKLIRALG
jgi:hypothetical protein